MADHTAALVGWEKRSGVQLKKTEKAEDIPQKDFDHRLKGLNRPPHIWRANGDSSWPILPYYSSAWRKQGRQHPRSSAALFGRYGASPLTIILLASKSWFSGCVWDRRSTCGSFGQYGRSYWCTRPSRWQRKWWIGVDWSSFPGISGHWEESTTLIGRTLYIFK